MSIKEAIFKIQKAVSVVHKDGSNPHHDSTYPTLEGVLDVLNPHLLENNLIITQFTKHVDYGWVLLTEVSSSDGKDVWSTETPLLGLEDSKNKMQALGSAITYARRYSLMALFKLAPTDDDANSVGPEPLKIVQEKKRNETPAPTTRQAPAAKSHTIADGKYKGKKISAIPAEELKKYIAEIEAATKSRGKSCPKWFVDMKKAAGL